MGQGVPSAGFPAPPPNLALERLRQALKGRQPDGQLPGGDREPPVTPGGSTIASSSDFQNALRTPIVSEPAVAPLTPENIHALIPGAKVLRLKTPIRGDVDFLGPPTKNTRFQTMCSMLPWGEGFLARVI